MKRASRTLPIIPHDAADDFLAITTENSAAYKDVLSTLAFLVAGGTPKGRNEQATQWEFDFALAIKSDTWRGSLYRSLNLQELAILLEADLIIHYSKILLNYGMNQTFADILSSPLFSLNLKIGISVLRRSFRSVSLWVCTEDGGKHMPVVIDGIVQNFRETFSFEEDSSMQEVRDRAIQDMLNSSVTSSKTVEGSSERQVIDNMSHEVFTRDLLRAMLSKSHRADIDFFFSDDIEIRSACAVHARRLYDFSEDIPDEWVLNAVK